MDQLRDRVIPYLSPEEYNLKYILEGVNAENVDQIDQELSDVFSVGIIIYKMCTLNGIYYRKLNNDD